MDVAPILFVHWVFTTFLGFIVDESPLVEAPDNIPNDAEEISNEVLHKIYGRYGMSEYIRFFIQNGHIYVYYESMDGLKIWQSVEIPHGWRVKEDFQLMCYSWINCDDDGFPQNLQILVFFDRGFLKLTFSSKLARHEVKDNNFVRLVDISVHPYSSISDARHGQQTMYQYVYDESVLFVSASQCNCEFVLTFEEIYFDERFKQYVCKVVLPLSKDVVIEYISLTSSQQYIFFDLWGKLIKPNFCCYLKATISGKSFLMELSLDPQSVQQYFADDGTEGLGVYSRRTSQNFRNFDCVKRSVSDLVGNLSFQDSDELDVAKLLEIFPVN